MATYDPYISKEGVDDYSIQNKVILSLSFLRRYALLEENSQGLIKMTH
jgi:hypothetical protein